MIQPQRNVSLQDKCSFKIGGTAAWYVRPLSLGQLESSLIWAQAQNMDTFILGRGTNLLISDSGWNGLVLDMTNICSITWNQKTVYVDAGVLLHALVTHAVTRGLSGIEQLAGIPGTVGGGVIMNAGAFEQTISDTLQFVDVFDAQENKIVRFAGSELEFGYRWSNLRQSGSLVVGASFLLHNADTPSLKKTYRSILQRRRLKQPLNYPNCGSVFKRPPGNYAGTLIEKCGLKGMRIGGAMVSVKHANFIVNDSHACAEDVRAIIATAQKRVYEQTGILLETEVIFVGDFKQQLFFPEDHNASA